MLRLRLALLCAVTTPAWAADPLPALGADVRQITVSGISSGGYMSVQFHVAHSDRVSGAGILAGGPYECAEGSSFRALNNCMAPDADDPVPATRVTLARVSDDADAGRIDAPSGLTGDRVWLFSGDRDETVERPVMDALAAFYRTWISGDALAYVKLPDAGHAMISADDPGANACETSDPPFINQCPLPAPPGGLFDAPGALLNHLLGPLQAKAAEATGEIIPFDQTPFTDQAGALGMGRTGYAYVPESCRDQACQVHVAFHGCRQSADQIGTTYVTEAGYNRWAESNRLIILYPQTIPRYGWTWSGWWPSWVFNPKGCWDWWGYEDEDYATAQGVQIKSVMAMVERLGQPRP